jgi:hypothetical protein
LFFVPGRQFRIPVWAWSRRNGTGPAIRELVVIRPNGSLGVSKLRKLPRTCKVGSSRHDYAAYVRAFAASSRAPLPEYRRLPTVMANLSAACASRFAMSLATLARFRCVSAISSGRQAALRPHSCHRRGQAPLETLHGFKGLAESASDRNIIVWLNEYFGPHWARR